MGLKRLEDPDEEVRLKPWKLYEYSGSTSCGNRLHEEADVALGIDFMSAGLLFGAGVLIREGKAL